MPQPFIFRTVDLDGQTLRTAVRPGKPHLTPLLIFNGIGANLELVFPFVAALDPDLEVIAFDVPGVGGSSTPESAVSLSGPGETHGADARLPRLRASQRHRRVLGWRPGPAVCLRLPRALQETRAGGHRGRRRDGAGQTESAVDDGQPAALHPAVSRDSHRADDLWRFVPSRSDPGRQPRRKVRSAGKLGYYWQLFAGLGWTSIHWLHKIHQPTLVLAGDDDPLIPLINMRMLAWRIPNAQLHIIDDGHLFLITRAEAVAPIIMKFLEEERQRAVMHPHPDTVRRLTALVQVDRTPPAQQP